ncbi:hypothetical protein ASG75_00595 [Rhodanobacter sp. Soil772]|nr:hypothetical protein ASG75_00595 [Rhodanobacter sp. Soil772]
MKSRKPLLTVLAAGTLLFAGSLIAQQDLPTQAPPPPPTDTMPQPPPVPPTPPAPPPPAQSGMPATPPPAASTAVAPPTGQADTATMNTPAGELTVHSSMPPPPPAGPAPAFEQLSGGGKYISEDQASAYPLLANDFLYADHNRDGRISKSEYARWTTGK